LITDAVQLTLNP